MSDQFGIFRPTDGQALYRLSQRVDNLERRLRASSISGRPAGTGGLRLLWTVAGPLTALGKSNAFDFESGDSFTLNTFRIRLAGAGSSTTTVELRKNGTAVASLSLAAAATTIEAVQAIPFIAGDLLEYALTAFGAGAADLQASARLVSAA